MPRPTLPRPTRRRLKIVLGLLLLPAVVAAVVWLRPAPPVTTFEQARQALSRARSAEAATYAAGHLADAETAWNTAMSAWQRENERWFLVRDYAQAALAADDAARQATLAADQRASWR